MASANIYTGDQSDGQNRFVIEVTDDEGKITRASYVVPDGETVRSWLLARAREQHSRMVEYNNAKAARHAERLKFQNPTFSETIDNTELTS